MKYKIDNVRPSKLDTRDRLAKLPLIDNLPTAVDLKPWADEVEDQLSLGSCTANAGCSALELAYNRAGIMKDFSRLYLYWYTRLLGGIAGDDGAYPRDIGKALNKYGVCLEPTWEYIQSKVNIEPNMVAQTEAKEYPTLAYERISGGPEFVITNIKNALALGIPVLTSLWIHESFMQLSGDWKTQTWDVENSVENPVVGGHEVLIIGYDDEAQRFLAENSWGPGWGDGGFFGIPYSYIGSTIDEWWILTQIGVPYVPVNKEIQPLPPAPPPYVDERDGLPPIAVGLIVAAVLALVVAVVTGGSFFG